jgi:hypothetical protein
MKYDEITNQIFDKDIIYFVVRKGSKYGVVDHTNRVVLPFVYQSIDFGLPNSYASNGLGMTAVVQKKRKFGTINMKKMMLIPMEYDDLKKVEQDGLYKAKKKGSYSLVNAQNEVLHPGPFDDIAQFERGEALTFYQGKMRVMDAKGIISSEERTMSPHIGYTSFVKLKADLYDALVDSTDERLLDFCEKIAPSQHLLYYLPTNSFSGKKMGYTYREVVVEKYFQELKNYKYREFRMRYYDKGDSYMYQEAIKAKRNLLEINDYTVYKRGMVTLARSQSPAYGDRTLEKILRSSLHVNGYWISTYFMTRRF